MRNIIIIIIEQRLGPNRLDIEIEIDIDFKIPLCNPLACQQHFKSYLVANKRGALTQPTPGQQFGRKT